MFGISGEHLLILGIILLFVGPRKLPELGNTLGKAIRNFKDAVNGIEEAKFRKIDETVLNQHVAATEAQKASSPSSAEADSAPQPPTDNKDGPHGTG